LDSAGVAGILSLMSNGLAAKGWLVKVTSHGGQVRYYATGHDRGHEAQGAVQIRSALMGALDDVVTIDRALTNDDIAKLRLHELDVILL
jgi:hypothetical protein